VYALNINGPVALYSVPKKTDSLAILCTFAKCFWCILWARCVLRTCAAAPAIIPTIRGIRRRVAALLRGSVIGIHPCDGGTSSFARVSLLQRCSRVALHGSQEDPK